MPNGGIFISVTNTPNHFCNYLEPLTFHIIDSPMGSGKSSALIRHIRESRMYRADTNKRFIVFVSSIKERDERFLQKLNAKQPPTEPYCKSILGLIARGDNIVTTQSLYNIFNDETIQAFHKSDYAYTAFFDEIPPLFQGASGGTSQKDGGVITRFGSKDVRVKDSDQPVYVYIPDRRMRELLYAFMEKAKVNSAK